VEKTKLEMINSTEMTGLFRDVFQITPLLSFKKRCDFPGTEQTHSA